MNNPDLSENSHLSDIRFNQLKLHPSLIKGLEDAGFAHCTPIQAEALPVALRGEDVAGQAQTGTGKTAAFLLAAFNHLLSETSKGDVDNPVAGRSPRTLIIAPTRELALQIHKDAMMLGKYTDLSMALAYGGTDYEQQRDTIASGTDILIGTPGRLIDYLKQGVYSLDSIEVVILDEADRMFDLGFIKDMRYILRHMPPPDMRLNMLFSATLSHRVMELAYEHMNDPRTIRIESDRTVADNIREVVYYPSNVEKIRLLIDLLSKMDDGRVLTFTNTRHAADQVGAWLKANGHDAVVLTGEVPQKKRESMLKRFADGRCNIMVATDVAARGLHIPAVSHVINFDLPQDPEDYVHRIGRTARAGASGDAVSFACEDYAFHLLDIESYIGHPIQRESINVEELPQLTRPEQQGKRDTRSQKRDKNAPRPRTPKELADMPLEDSTSAPQTASDEIVAEQATLNVSNSDDDVAEVVRNAEGYQPDSADGINESVIEAEKTADSDNDNQPKDIKPQDETTPHPLSSNSKWNVPGIEIPAIG